MCVVFRSKPPLLFHVFLLLKFTMVTVYCACTPIWTIKFKEKIGLVVDDNLYSVISVKYAKGKLI